ncbi:peptidyl-prolyl cis-trans isomerase [Candidatus Dependentiae bacterium]|nr:peptidyl-prolyl cis-trans isomerase [Candidatus Dependentiae bacterium]
MKKTTMLRPFFNGALLVSSLALLSACDWFKQSDTCTSCVSSPAATGTGTVSADDVLLSIDGKPVVTKKTFDEFYEMAIASDPQSQFGPGVSQKIYNYLEQAALMDASIKKTKKDQDPEYKRKLDQAYELARATVNGEYFQKEVLDTIDVSDKALEAFYTEQVGKNPAFERPPFMKKAGGIKVMGVQFNDDKSAKDFLAKATKPGADLAALAKADNNRKVEDLGVITAQSRADRAVVAKAKDMQPNAVEKVDLSNGKFMVIKTVGPRQAPEYMSFTEIMANEDLKNYFKQVKQSTDFQAAMTKRLDDIKKDVKIESNTKYIEEKESKQNAELEALIKSMRGSQEEQGTAAPQAQKAQSDKAATPKAEKVESAKSM